MQFPNLTILQDSRILKFALVVCWLATLFIGFNRFIDQDVLLSVSVVGQVSLWLSIVVALVLFSFPVLGLFNSRGAILYAITLVVFGLFVLLDVNRLTPYFIFYLGVFGVYILFRKDEQVFYKSLIIIASGIYIASGLHKLNPGFSEDILPLIWFHSLPIQPSENLGYAIALLEALLGLGLLFNKTRKVACLLLIITHTILLWKLGPFKLSWNLIVWPWNFAMIALLCLIYGFRSQALLFSTTYIRNYFAVLLFFWCLPLLSLFHLVPDNLGFKLYSGKVLNPLLQLNTKLVHLETYNYSTDPKVSSFMLQDYSIRTSQLAISPEPWVFERIKENFEKEYQTTGTLIYNSKEYLDNLNQK
jgi:hypothetical protein